jgi:hypothetical protein
MSISHFRRSLLQVAKYFPLFRKGNVSMKFLGNLPRCISADRASRTEKRPILEYLPEFSTSKEEGGLNGGLRTE